MPIILLTLALLALGLALNLQLTLTTLRSVRLLRPPPTSLPPGEAVPPIAARTLDGAAYRLPAGGQPTALLFLSSACPKCRGKLVEVAQLLPAAAQAGLAMWIVSAEPARRLRSFLAAPDLLAACVRVRQRDANAINPTAASPAYLFIDHDGVLQSAGLIGDDDWCSLRDQLIGGAAADAP